MVFLYLTGFGWFSSDLGVYCWIKIAMPMRVHLGSRQKCSFLHSFKPDGVMN